MLTRRAVLAGLAARGRRPPPLSAQDWKAKYPELVFAVVPAENASGVVERYTPFVNYLSSELGTKVTLRIANDYAAVIEGQRAGHIHIAMYGPASYARAFVTGVQVEPFAIEINLDGTKGYHSVLYVKKDAPYQKIEDLKGKNLCLVDPNSTSGNNVPRFAMNKMGIDPEKFFGKVVYAGSHENAVIAVQQGTCDVAFNWWNDENRVEPSAHGAQEHGEGRRLPHHLQVRADRELADGLSERHAGRPEESDPHRRAGGAADKDKAAFDKIYEGKQGPWFPSITRPTSRSSSSSSSSTPCARSPGPDPPSIPPLRRAALPPMAQPLFCASAAHILETSASRECAARPI